MHQHLSHRAPRSPHTRAANIGKQAIIMEAERTLLWGGIVNTMNSARMKDRRGNHNETGHCCDLLKPFYMICYVYYSSRGNTKDGKTGVDVVVHRKYYCCTTNYNWVTS